MRKTFKPSYYLHLSSFLALTLSGNLLAATDVTNSSSDNGSGAEGTLSAAINTVNSDSNDQPINLSVDPSLSGNMPNITISSLTVQTNGSDTRTINAGGYNAIPVISGTTTLTPQVTLSNATASATNGTLVLKGPNNWNNLNNIALNNGTVNFSYADTQSISQTYSGNISVEQKGTIKSPWLKKNSYNAYPQLTLTGQIQESSPGTCVTFDSISSSTGYLTLNSTLGNSWTGGTTLSGEGGLRIKKSNSFPGTGDVSIESNNYLAFDLTNSDSFTGTGNFSGPGTLYIYGGTITLSGNISNLHYLQSEGNLNASGNISNTQTYIRNGNANLSGNISGNNALSLESSGTLILSGDNSSYSGSISLTNGTLQVSSITNLGTATLSINNATLHATGNITLNSVTMCPPSRLNTDSGATLTIPILNITPYDTSTSLTLNGSGTNIIEQFSFTPYQDWSTYPTTYKNSTLNIIGILGGTTGLTLNNSAPSSQAISTLSVSEANTYTGNTVIKDYTALQINNGASITTPNDKVTIDQYGTLNVLAGGSLTALEVVNSGAVTGCGTINGNLSSNSGSIFLLLESGDCSKLTVSGNVVLNSNVTLQINPKPESKGGTYEFLTATSLSGTFSQIYISDQFTASVSYTPTTASVTITPITTQRSDQKQP